MASVAATRTGRGSHSVFRGVVLGVLLVAAVIVGLLAMHTLNLHGTAAAEAPASMSMAASEPAHASHSPATAAASGDAQSERSVSCAGCSADDHSGMAMICVLALLLAMLLLIPPGVLRRGPGTVLRTPLAEVVLARLAPRPPSLHVLCISRT